MDKVAIVDTTFARFDMGSGAVAELTLEWTLKAMDPVRRECENR